MRWTEIDVRTDEPRAILDRIRQTIHRTQRDNLQIPLSRRARRMIGWVDMRKDSRDVDARFGRDEIGVQIARGERQVGSMCVVLAGRGGDGLVAISREGGLVLPGYGLVREGELRDVRCD